MKSLKFWAEPAFDQTVCPSVDPDTAIFDFHDFPSSPRQLTRNVKGPTFFGGDSVLGKRFASLNYKCYLFNTFQLKVNYCTKSEKEAAGVKRNHEFVRKSNTKF